MFDGIYKELGMVNTFDVWYVTLNRKLKKRKSFTTINEVKKWCKLNKNKVKITSGSWQVLEIMKSI
jgi:hypothetical protein